MQRSEDVLLPNRVAIVYSHVLRDFFATEEEYLAEEDADVYANAVGRYVAKMGIQVITLPCDRLIAENLKKFKPDLVLNLVDSLRGQSSLGSSIIGLYEILHIPYTGAGTLGWSIGTNKFVMYQLMRSNGIPIPNHQLVTSHTEMIDPDLRYPLFPKLNLEHSSIGIDNDSICENEKALRSKLKQLLEKYKQPVLVDEFIAGVEVTAAVLDGSNTKVYSVQRSTEQQTREDVMTFEKKWVHWENISYSKIDFPGLKEYVKKAFAVLKMSDYGRIDVRVDAAGRLYFIDPNCNPFFGPVAETHATYSIILDMYGVDFTQILKRMFVNTMNEAKENMQNSAIS